MSIEEFLNLIGLWDVENLRIERESMNKGAREGERGRKRADENKQEGEVTTGKIQSMKEDDWEEWRLEKFQGEEESYRVSGHLGIYCLMIL